MSFDAAVETKASWDAFAAGVITGIVRGWEMPESLRYASALGGSATRAVGTTDPVFSAAEAEAFLDSHTLDVRSRTLQHG